MATVISDDLEVFLLSDVSTTWQTVNLSNSFTNAIPICTYVLRSFDDADPPAVTRIRNITSSSFDVRIQGWEDSAATTSDVHCIVADEGVHQLPDGRLFEAHTVLSDQTSGQYSTDGAWSQAILEDVSASVLQTYNEPIVLGQVISFNDSRASVFHTTDCDSRGNPPFQAGQSDGICVGKHIGMISDVRNSETLGYIVAEAGSGTVNGIFYELAQGPNTIAGNATSPSGTYTVSADHSIGVLTQGGENGGNGSWAVLYGYAPLPPNEIKLQVDEEIFVLDVTRRHAAEEVFYWVFALSELTLQKKVINDDDGTATFLDFPLTATGPDTITGVSDDDSITSATVMPGKYVLSETTEPGYIASVWSCIGGELQGDTILLLTGESATCTIVNDDSSLATLTLVKKVINDNSGTALDSDFKLTFDNGSGISDSGVSGDPSITSVPVTPGEYKLFESSLTGYTLTSIVCDGSDVDGLDGLILQNTENVTCVFVNDDQGIDLELKKQVNDTSPNIGDVLTFTLTVVNNGPDQATDVKIIDQLPAGFTYQAASISGGSSTSDSDPSGTGLQWKLDSLNSGTSTTLSFNATVNAQ